MIQTKLSTPTNSTNGLNIENSEIEEIPQEKPARILEEKQPSRIIPYRPPSINLSTWSERPKTQISVKEDTDYKMKNGTSKIVVNTEPTLKKSVQILNNNNNVSIKVNGTEPIVSQSTGNVIIKIGANSSECTYRKPFGNINGIEQKPRPHSVAIDSNGEVSRVPIVRSVELKKPFRDSQLNKSVTQIYPDETGFYKTNFPHDFTNYSSVENRRNSDGTNGLMKQSGSDSNFYVGAEIRPVLRVTNPAPVVRGFRPSENYRKSWNVNGNNVVSSTNNNTPFGNVVLKSTQNNHRNSLLRENSTSTDPRDALLSAIRNFGGKKGLKSIKT